ncbi:MAG: hypothetical protein RSE93_07820 [Oscillospiraceae bacterium]
MVQRMQEGVPYGVEVAEKTRIDLYHYLDNAFLNNMTEIINK